jgi:hypothetical protein
MALNAKIPSRKAAARHLSFSAPVLTGRPVKRFHAENRQNK